MKRITIKDLSKMLNLSTSTISRALSDHPDISDATKKRVKTVAKELNYTTNMHARFFRKQHSGLIALILPEVNMFYTPNLIKGVNRIIDSSKYSLIIFLSNDELEKEAELIKQCIGWAVEGVLLSISKETENITHLKPLLESEVKTIIIDRILEKEGCHSLQMDSELASYNATKHLIDNGHKEILGVFGGSHLEHSINRVNGYKRALIDHNIQIKEENILLVNNSNDLNLILPPILKNNQDLTAIFTMSDELLSYCLFNLKKANLNIPSDVSIVAISDGKYPLLCYPKVSHIEDSGQRVGETAVKQLISMIEGEKDIPKHRKLSSKLIQLDSVANI